MHTIHTVFDLLSVHALISVHPFLISRIHNYCNLSSVEQLKCRHLVLNSWHHFSVVLHQSPNDTANVKELPYCLEKKILVYTLFVNIFYGPNIFQGVHLVGRTWYM